MIGCVTAISMNTGKVCKLCQKHETDENTPACGWKAGKMQINHRGSARIFRCSKAKCNLHSREFYRDQDSKSYSAVKNTYEKKDVTVAKKECVGHVHKRLGTALRNLKKQKKGLGGKGRLTDPMIDKPQNYYGISSRSNSGDLDTMKKIVYATLFHCASSLPQKQ